MQPKYTHNSKSNIIKATEEAKRKSRQRLIGSIILLFFALLVLLHVTAKVKPIPINPDVVEIKSTASSSLSAPLNLKTTNVAAHPQLISSAPAVSKAAASLPTAGTPPALSSAPVTAKKAASAENIKAANNSIASGNYKASLKADNNKQALPLQGTISQPAQENQSVDLDRTQPTKVKAKAKPKVNPADILDGVVDQPKEEHKSAAEADTQGSLNRSYIQFAALSSEENALKLQQSLARHGVHAVIHPLHTGNGTLYRLRAGPFSREEARKKLHELANEGYSGIVTGH